MAPVISASNLTRRFGAFTVVDAFARISGYLSSLRKQGLALLAALEAVVIGQPLYPALD